MEKSGVCYLEDFIRRNVRWIPVPCAVEHNSMVCGNDKFADVELTRCDKITQVRMIFQDIAVWPLPTADHMNEALAEKNRMANLLRNNEEARSVLQYTSGESWTVPKGRVE